MAPLRLPVSTSATDVYGAHPPGYEPLSHLQEFGWDDCSKFKFPDAIRHSYAKSSAGALKAK
jgi:hypothetical protein